MCKLSLQNLRSKNHQTNRPNLTVATDLDTQFDSLKNMKLKIIPYLSTFLLFSALAISIKAQTSADWIRVRGNTIPSDAVVAGNEDDGRKTYVCRVRYGDRTIAGKALDDRCYYNPGSGERSASRFSVLTGSGYSWSRTRNYSRAVIVGGDENDNHYVCRVSRSGGLYAGSLRSGRCYYTRNNRGYSSRSFEVLVGMERTTSLAEAASRGDYEAVREALSDGQAIDQRDSDEKTPLILAAENGRDDVVGLLLRRRALVDARDDEGNTAFIYAASKGHRNIARKLYQEGADRSVRNNDGETAFTLAAANGRKRVVRDFIGGDIYGALEHPEIEQAFRNTAQKGYRDTLDILLETGISPDSPDVNGRTALMYSVLGKELDTVKYLIARKANANAKDERGYTPFNYASMANSTKILNYFFDEIELEDKITQSEVGLRLAARYNNRDSLKFFVARSIDVNAGDAESGYTALMWASSEGHIRAARLLIAASADPNIRNNLGETALMLASAKGYIDVVKELLKATPNLDLQNDQGKTAAILAAANSRRRVLRALVKAGANVNLRDNQGITALGWAIRNKHGDTRKILRKAKAIQ